jgi:hypothetical protein
MTNTVRSMKNIDWSMMSNNLVFYIVKFESKSSRPTANSHPSYSPQIESRIMPSRKADVNIWIFNEYRSNKPRRQSRKSRVQKHGDTEITQKDTIETTRTKQTNRTEYERHKK